MASVPIVGRILLMGNRSNVVLILPVNVKPVTIGRVTNHAK